MDKVQEGLTYLNSLMQWRGTADFTLGPIKKTMEALGHPENSFKVAHVAGTNGKGSVSCMIAAGLAAAGNRVGLSISPHLSRVNERISIDGVPVSDETLAMAALRLKEAVSPLDLTLSFFEGVFALALIIFEEARVDWAVLEVGLGGRLDATNIVPAPEVSVITSIGIDHAHILGSSIEEITAEKCGIIKQGVPVISGVLQSSARQVVRNFSEQKNAGLYQINNDFSALGDYREFLFRADRWGPSFELRPSLMGEHQVRNSAVAAAALLEAGLSVEAVQKGIESARWPARMEVIQPGQNKLVLDCGHNLDGINSCIASLAQLNIERYKLVTGFLDTKDWKEMLDKLVLNATEILIIEPESDRAVPGYEVLEWLSSNEIRKVNFERDYAKLVSVMQADLSEYPILCVGSIYMVGKVRELLLGNGIRYW